jgi:hypothetical protein
MAYRFMMMNGNRPIECSVSNALFNYLEKSRYPTGNPEACFSAGERQSKGRYPKKCSIGNPDAVSIHLFLKDFKFGLVNKT